ncbi:MAG: PASTA domain-containing protein [Treponema sp.]|nr:PASTA domain-containing protein [Treponema sp.]
MAFKNLSGKLDGLEDYVGSHLRLFISLTVGLLVFVGMISLSVFFIAVRGKEQVMVPDVTGEELTQALLKLQVKELYPEIQLRFSNSSDDKGLILEQSPDAGTVVKAERRISLVVSSGVTLDKVGNYLGRNINDVRSDIAAVPLLSIKEPFMYQYAAEAAGTVIQQNPPAGTDLTGPAALELVVSRGQENVRITVPNLEGAAFQTALERLIQARINFIFEIVPPGEGDIPETVAAQNPFGGSEISAGDTMTVSLYAPVPGEGEAAGLFRYTLPRNPYPLPVTVDALLPGGATRRLAGVNHPGGNFTLPYRLPDGSTIVLTMLDRELYRQTVRSEESSPEQF